MKSAKRTAKKRMVSKSESENRFSIHDFPAPAILYTKKNSVIVDWNSAASKLLGYKPGERPYLKVIRPKGIRAKRNVAKSKVGVSMGIVPHTTKNGEEKLIEVINKQIIIKEKVYCLEWLLDQTELVQSQLSQLHFYGAVTRASIVSRADLRGNITYVNSNFIKISGYAQKELLGKNHHVINSGYHPKSFWVSMWKTIASGKTWRAEVKNKAKDGSYYWVDTFVMPFTDANGKVSEFLSIRNDITSRKQSEEALAVSNSRLSETLIFGKMGSVELNLATHELEISKEMLYLMDMDAQEPVKMPIDQFINSFIHPSYSSLIKNTITQGISAQHAQHDTNRNEVNVQFELVSAKGRRICMDAKGLFTNQSALGILQDITEKKNALEHLRSRNHLIQNMLAGITDGFFATDRELNFTIVNPAFLALAKMQEQDMIGKNILTLFPFMEESDLLPKYRTAIQTGQSLTIENRSSVPSGNVLQIQIYPNPEGLFVFYKDITEQKKTEEEIKKLALIASRTSNAVLLTNMQGEITWVNEGFERITEYFLHEVIGRKPGDFLQGAETDTRTVLQMHHALAKGDGFKVELLNYSKSGRKYWLDIEVMPMKNEADELIGYMAIESDITALKEAINEMQRSEQTLRAFMNYAPMIAFAKDVKGRYTFYNKAYLDFMGDKELSVGATDYDLFDKDFADQCTQRDQHIISTGESLEFEHQVINQTFLEYKFPMHDVNNKIFAVGGVSVNITEKLEAQRNLQKVYDELNAMLNASTDATFFLDSQYRIIVFNQVGADLIWKIYGKRVQRGDSMITYSAQDTRQAFEYNFNRAIQGEVITLEREIIYSETITYWWEVRYLPVKNDQGQIIGVSFNSTDITARKLAERDLFQSKKYFESLINSQSSYLIRTDMEGRYTYVNKKFEEIFSRDNESMIGSSSLLNIIEEDHDLCRQTVEYCFTKPGKVIPVTLRKPKRSGGFYWTEWEFVALHDARGTLQGIQAVGLDATDRIVSQLELKKVEERFRLLVRDVNVGILLQGKNAEIFLSNDAALELLALTEDQLMGKTSYSKSWDIIQEDGSDFPGTAHPVPRAILSKQPVRSVLMGVYRPTKQDRVWLLVDAIPRLDEYGEIKDIICTFNDVTKLKIAEANEGETRERLRVIANNLPSVAIYQYELLPGEQQGRYKYFSEGVELITGIPVDQLIADSSLFENQIHPEDWAVKQLLISEANLNLTVFDQEYRFRHKNGSWRWLRTRSQPTQTRQGGPVIWNGLIIDITNQKETEIKLVESEQRFNDFMQHTPVGNWITDKAGTIVYLNQSYRSLFDFQNKEDAIGKSVFDVYPPAMAKQFLDTIQQVAESKNALKTIELAPRMDGTIGEFLVYKFPMANDLVGGTAIDISDQKEAERKLIESEERLRSIIQNEPNCVKILNQKGELLEMNNSGLTMIGADSLQQVAGKKMIDIVDESFREQFATLTKSVINGHSGTLEFSVTGLKGEKKWLETKAVPLKDQVSDRNLLLGITRDITEQKRRSQLLRAIRELQASFITQSEPKVFFDFALHYILQLTESEYGFVGEVLYEDNVPYLKTTSITNIAWNEETRAFYDMHASEGLLFRNLKTLFGLVMTKGELVISNAPYEDERRGGLPHGHPALNAFAGIPLHKGNQMIGMLGVANRKDGYSKEAMAELQPLVETLSNIVEAYRNEKARKEFEKQLLVSLNEKEILIREIHHRVKNNFQLISSIIFIRMNKMDEGDLKYFLAETRQKIHAISLIHEKLLQSSELINEVEVNSFLHKLLRDLQVAYATSDTVIEVKESITPVYFNLDAAINCSLVLIELFTNAMKYAFVGRDKGLITVELEIKNNYVYFSFTDDGIGLPESIQPGHNGSFGMQMLDVLFKQLKAKVEIDRQNGTSYKIIFLSKGIT